MFQSFYESPLQHPWLLLVAPSLFLTMLLHQRIVSRKTGSRSTAPHDNAHEVRSSHGNHTKNTERLRTSFTAPLIAFSCLTIADPLLTGPLVSLFAMSAGVSQALAITFVILGDFRWFFFFELFVERQTDRAVISPRALIRALACSFIVPVTQAIIVRVGSSTFENTRLVFLAYELLFFALLLVFLKFRVPTFLPQKRAFNRALVIYALAYYGLWVIADVIILMGFDVGFLLRVLPNQLYYSFFLPFVWWGADKMSNLSESR